MPAPAISGIPSSAVVRRAAVPLAFALASLMHGAVAAESAAPPVRGMVELEVAIDARPAAEIDADALVVPVFENEAMPPAPLAGAETALAQAIRVAAAQRPKHAELFTATSFFKPAGLRAARLVLIGAGAEKELDAERIRRLAGTAARQVRREEVGSMAFVVRGAVEASGAVAAAAEGAILGLFDAGLHKSEDKPPRLKSLRIAGAGPDSPALRQALEGAALRAHATNFARSITVEPANYVTPEVLAAHARTIGREAGLEVEVFDDRRMARMGLGGVLAVGKGSANPPRFIVLRYRPPAPSEIVLALAGKGVCFDSGGISIKPAEEMHRMKGDMAGGAAVLAAMKIIGRQRPPIQVIGVVPAVENIPGPGAQRPGDVFTGYSGTKVEVLNTDAEGRLILADAVAYAVAQGATHVVDVATLTGSVRQALGDRHAGAFASDDALFEALRAAASRSGESFWRLPIDEEYAKKIKDSLVADLTETGGEGAGATVGAKFIQQFTKGKPWIHLDIAGTSWPKEPPPWLGPGPTGIASRTLAELAFVLGDGVR